MAGPNRRQRSWEVFATVPLVAGMILVTGLVGYDALEQAYPALGTWQFPGAPVMSIDKGPWNGVEVARRIRLDTLDAAVISREVLLGQPSPGIDRRRDLLRGVRRDLQTATLQYEAINPVSKTLPQWIETRDLLQQYWKVLDLVLALGQESRASGRSVDVALQALGAYQTDIFLQVDRLAEFHHREILDAQTRLLEWGNRSQRQVFLAVVGCLAIAFGIAVLPMAHAWRTQRHLEAEYQKALSAKQELQRLSAELLRMQEEERRSLSRELHDELGQALTAARLDMALLEQRIPSQMGELQGFARDGKILLEQTLQRVRDLCRLLRPGLLDEQGLAPAARWLVNGYVERTGIDITLETRGPERRLPPEYELAGYRFIQEGLTNIARHSGASQAQVRIETENGHLRLTVEDNGCGIRPNALRGLGLLGIRERMEQLGGSFEVSSTPGAGVRLAAAAPLPATA